MSSNLGMATGELQQMHVEGGGESLWREALKRLLRDKIAVFGGIVIVLLVFVAVAAPLITPHKPHDQAGNGTSAYGMPLPINSWGKKLTLELKAPVERELIIPPNVIYVTPQGEEFTARDNITFKPGEKTLTVPVNPVSPAMAKAQGGSMLKIENADELNLPVASAQLINDKLFLLGTDASGRDVLSRLIFGAQVSLQVGVIAIGLAVVIGTVLGLISGYFGGWVDTVIMRFTDIMMAFPDLLLVMAIVAVINPSQLGNSDRALDKILNGFFGIAALAGITPEVIFICIAISIVSWTQYARLVRGQVLTIREMEFVEASQSLGAKSSYIMFRHILPNVVAPIIVVATMGVAGAIMTEASLSFLGFGVKVPTSSWGSMINDGLGYFRDAPLIPLIPGLAIAITVFAFNLFGDGVRDALDPRLK
jgi:peptide/nickel transport system permease protein